MLDPEYLETAGDLVAGVYSEIEADMCDHLVRAMLAGDVSDWRSQTALALLAQGQAPQLRMVLERYRPQINEAVRREVEGALARSDAHDLAVVKRALGIDLPKVSTQRVALAVKTVCEMLERDNVDLMAGARDAFFRESSRAVTEAGSGLYSIDEAMLRATRRLARDGIDMIQYRDPTTGDKTVRNHVDVAVRRHVRTQLQQACAERTMEVCGLTGCGFVEVSSHYGARPSHQEWEGRVYSLKGRATVDGVTYEDFHEGTGYEGLAGPYVALGDRLCGVNCRHHFGPWFPGMPRAYHPNPKHPSGKSNAEIYDLTQRQRALERELRATKRELSAALRVYEADPSLKNQAVANQLKERLKAQNDRMRKLCSENRDVLTRQPNREYAGDMPRVRVPAEKADNGQAWKAFPQTKDTMRETRGIRRLGRPEITELQRKSDETFASMTEGERSAIEAYTTGRHNEINQRLYGTRRQTAKVRERADDAISHMDSAMGRFDLGQGVVMFSGTDAAHYEDWAVGDVRELKGFVSSSVRYKDALRFLRREESKGSAGLMLRIRVPAGTTCLFVGENTSFPAYQGEMILGHGLKYKVISRTEGSMELEVVPDVDA